MRHKQVTSTELSRAPGKAKRMAKIGPVFITERGEPGFVLLSAEDYRRLAGRGLTLAEALAMPGEYVELPMQRGADLPEVADLD